MDYFYLSSLGGLVHTDMVKMPLIPIKFASASFHSPPPVSTTHCNAVPITGLVYLASSVQLKVKEVNPVVTKVNP